MLAPTDGFSYSATVFLNLIGTMSMPKPIPRGSPKDALALILALASNTFSKVGLKPVARDLGVYKVKINGEIRN